MFGRAGATLRGAMARSKPYHEGDAFARGEDDPEGAAEAAEAVKAIRERLDPLERAVLDLMLEGHDEAAIAKRLGKKPADLARTLASIRKVAGDLGA